MAKVTKATREVMDVDNEIKKVTKSKTDVKKEKKPSKGKSTKKSSSKTKKTGVLAFVKDVRKEMSKVKWPGKKDMVKYSFATICFIIFFAVFFYIIEVVIALLKAWV